MNSDPRTDGQATRRQGARVPSLSELLTLTHCDDASTRHYVEGHYERFRSTWNAFASGTHGTRRGHLLDIGSHWLQQTLIWRLQGFAVTAVDVPATIETDQVRRIAREQDITLCANASLEQPDGLAALPDDSVDVILFSEVIEHLAFNPLVLWRTLYRLLRPGGLIVITTPNYYALRGRAWRPLRFLGGGGGGITVREILGTPSFGHHWREFAAVELREYFALLSPDFSIDVLRRLPRMYRNRRLASLLTTLERGLPLLRDQLYLEVSLPQKHRGITFQANW